ncbi:hypothetical protein TTHERM_000578575 (macronuclear) [Tetrahymena thermophila SB210]|uniref:Uncharacterized protein n=1 Tax=Tetrahymena thermophila (strain SB210) TaxID=312017 RepID=W7X526_TETTS|nr:hypothetical protein TTHERM_000578575 [Tetrahymena thermophila SB210]EWS72512.1 hypothetical protein TTHERM_000578575 [Tetrahymena thermophila SB210]|eukprot:XP_012654948.1 hypothetical protein TTHERM_000578575 [Tetrahymena thermophila SB210]
MSNLVKIYDCSMMSEVAQVGLNYEVSYANILVDSLYKRIFVQNKLPGTLVYDFMLNADTVSYINSFSAQLYFDDYFIYSVVSHSANIYFRKDLKLLFNFRHFNSTFYLKKITYLNVGYYFLVEFINKLSIFEFSPFVSLPTEKAFLLINQFSIAKYSFIKQNEFGINSNIYEFEAIIFQLEGIITYTIQFDIYSLSQSQSCSLNYEQQQFNYQDDIYFWQQSLYLASQQKNINSLTINIPKDQNIYIPQLQQNILYSEFQLIIQGQNLNNTIYIQDKFNQQQGIYAIWLQNLVIQVSNQNYKLYLENGTNPNSLNFDDLTFPDLKQIYLENITINESIVQIKNIQQVVIQQINLTHFVNQKVPTLTQLEISNISKVIISEINIMKFSTNQQHQHI